MSNNLDYFKGWKAACYDVADFLEHLSRSAPPELGEMTSSYAQLAEGIRQKGDIALAMAEATQEAGQ